MKTTRRFISAVMALAMVSAVAPMSAFAITQDDIDPDTGKATGTMTATYDVTAKYTVTIPAGVELKSDASVSKDITASDVVLESGQKIKVSLTGASNTAEGSSFSAKNDKGDSTATYTISKGETAVAVGDVVAEFTEDGEQSLTFSAATGATYAGKHTETLTFTIAVEKPAAPSLADAFKNGSVTAVKLNNKNGGTNTYGFTYENGTFTSINPDGNNGYTSNFLNNVKLTKENNDLVLKTTSIEDGSITMTPQFVRTYTFDTSNNTYTYTPPTDVNNSIENCRTFISISVNGTEIPVTLES